ncbi:MAG: hypothetical protein LC778_06095 [Acidobacteria bacterium]|nr:hypothetical protein [Acidobacteriota bacterium]
MSKRHRPHGKPVFDTNIYSAYREKIEAEDLAQTLFPLVVYYELSATKISQRRKQKLDQFRQLHDRNKTLLTPTKDDWIAAASIVWQLHQRRRKDLPDSATFLQNDALICQMAHIWLQKNLGQNCFIVTENISHFRLIADCLNESAKKSGRKLKVISGDDYFGD